MDSSKQPPVQADGYPRVFTVLIHNRRLLFLVENYDERTGKLQNIIYSEYLTPEIARKLGRELIEKADQAESEPGE